MRRWLLAGVVLLVAGCEPGAPSSPAGPTTAADAAERWVVEGSLFDRATDTYSVICIPVGQVELDYTERARWRQVLVGRDQSYAAEPGDPCPAGPIRDSYGGAP